MTSLRYLSVSQEPEGTIVRLLSHTLRMDLMTELSETIRAIDSPRIVITGEDGFFAADADINELTELDGPRALEYARSGQSVINSIETHPAITIAAIDGYCMGGGLDLSLGCDLRYATSGSVFAHPGGRIGIMTGWGGTRRLPLMIGKSRALEMMAVGRRLTAPEALEWGLINGIVDDPVAFALGRK